MGNMKHKYIYINVQSARVCVLRGGQSVVEGGEIYGLESL